MADLGTLVTIAEKVFQLSQSQVIKDMKDWESDLESLNKSVSFIKNMLLDADEKPLLSHGEQAWVEELKEVLYEADDLFDEVITISKVKELNDGVGSFKKVLGKVSRFFSSKNRIIVSYNTSHEVKSIQQKLDAIAKDHSRYDFMVHARYQFNVDPQATLNRKVETCAFLDETHENIIGREDDVKVVVDMLLDPNVEENVEFVVIVGIGGLGKTTLAQLVCKHDRVGTRFDKKLWVCVSDQDGKGLDVQAILGNIIESSTNKKPSDVSTMQSMQTKLQEELKNKTYLLILDDVWTEDPNEWSKLRRYLTIGGRGSKVVITTRSEKTAEVVLGKATHSKKYMLKGLSDDDSWRLFVLTAFERESDEANDPKLTKIGQKVVKKCSNVPLAIKVLGTLLYGQTERWESFESNRLPQIETTKNPIMSILKLSYNNLEPSVKNCFRYCALFPKDFKMNKRELIYLWMAQGYIGDSEDCFLILLKRCFFQDVEKDKYGDVVSFKMHDLMHDLAQEVAGDEIIVLNSPNKLSKKNRHLFLDGGEWTRSSFREGNIRTYYMYRPIDPNVVKTLITRWPNLRSLRICLSDCTNLSESIGELLHLRHLDLSYCRILETLPNSIVNLYNLQSLIMVGCESLKEWPKYFSKLVNLKLLDISGCEELICMPLHMDQLINLRDLSDFSVGGGQLKDLKFLVNLRGELDIQICRNPVSEIENEWEDSYLEHMKNLKKVGIFFSNEGSYEANILAKLQPNQNLMDLGLYRYDGTEIPRWGRVQDDWSFILPNLVTIDLHYCTKLDGIPVLSNLKHLKELSLWKLNNLEYMETGAISRCSSGSKDIQFFPSLERLTLRHLERLKGWWGRVGEGDSSSDMLHWQPPFPHLSTLIINSCPKLTSLPPCPSLEAFEVQFVRGEGPVNLDLKLRVEETDVAFKNSSSLLSLVIEGCKTLKSVSGVLDHLTALKSLSLQSFAQVDYADMPWSSLHNLCSLELYSLESLEILPTGIKHLTALQNLTIGYCYSLKGLPQWISCLQSLHSLIIYYCPELNSLSTIQYITSLQKLDIMHCPHITEACREPSGMEWPKIRHIPHISFRN